ncbi:hypothetical protein DID75_02395 [Candidatus Marinamargulisbacteria bacterium SCGC AG-410-N11]|nr:hypothetical protein DID75_02395 [Candidatus Marinamargulisbacteria bacterium SCGC AG-410-N11]
MFLKRFFVFLLVLTLFFVNKLCILGDDLVFNLKPDPVMIGQKLHVSLISDVELNGVDIEISNGKKIKLKKVNDKLFNFNYKIGLNEKPGNYNVSIILSTTDGQKLKLPNTSFQVIKKPTLSKSSKSVEVNTKSFFDNSKTSNLNIKIDELEQNVDNLEQEKQNLKKKIKNLKNNINNMKKKLANEDLIKQKEEELKRLEQQLKKQQEELAKQLANLKNKLKDLNAEKERIKKQSELLSSLESKLKDQKSNLDLKSKELTKKSFLAEEKENYLYNKQTISEQRESNITKKEKALVLLEQEISSKNNELESIKAKLITQQGNLENSKQQIENEKNEISKEKIYLEQVSEGIKSEQSKLVELTLELKEKQDEFEQVKVANMLETEKKESAILEKQNQLDGLQILMANASDNLKKLEFEQQNKSIELEERVKNFEIQKVKFEKNMNTISKQKQLIVNLEKELQIKYDLLKSLNSWIQNQIGDLKLEYKKNNKQNSDYLNKFDEKFQQLEGLTRLIENRAQNLESYNKDLQSETILKDFEIESLKRPHYRYAFSPFLGMRGVSSSSQNGAEGGLRLVTFYNKMFSFQGGVSLFSTQKKESSLIKQQEHILYNISTLYDFNPGEKARFYLLGGIEGALNGNRKKIGLCSGVGFKYFINPKIVTRFEIKYSNELSATIGFENHISPIFNKIKNKLTQEKIKTISEVDQFSSRNLEGIISVPESVLIFKKNNVKLQDTLQHWSYLDVQSVLNLGLMDPKVIGSERLFDINSSINKADCSKILSRLANIEDLLVVKQVPISISFVGENSQNNLISVLILDSENNIIKTLAKNERVLSNKVKYIWKLDQKSLNTGKYRVVLNVSSNLLKVDENKKYTISENSILSEVKTIEVKEVNKPSLSSVFSNPGFSDIPKDFPGSEYIFESVKLGIFQKPIIKINKNDSISFNPYEEMKRVDFMVCVTKVLLHFGASLKPVKVDFTPYKDWNTINNDKMAYLTTYIVELGYGGDDQKRLRPNDLITRAEVATIINRVLKWKDNKQLISISQN